MNGKIKNLITVICCAAVIFGFAVWSIAQPDSEISDAERRYLRQFPAVSRQTVLSGSFMTEFEKYALDQFPLRDELRSIKAGFTLDILRQKDNNGYYIFDGHISELDYTLDTESVDNAAQHMKSIYNRYLDGKDCNIYLSVIPSKGFYMLHSGYPQLDHEALTARLCAKTGFAQYIDLSGALSLDSYYRTDPHWDQLALKDAAQLLASGMGAELSGSYGTVTASSSFHGAYTAQLAVSVEPDTLAYLTNSVLEKCSVYDYESGDRTPLYDLDAASGRDPYALFLNGSRSLLTIENPSCANGKELIIFRDSFACAIAPLLAEGYSKITLIDTRYISSARLGEFISFDRQDVLFLYSSSVINSSDALQ